MAMSILPRKAENQRRGRLSLRLVSMMRRKCTSCCIILTLCLGAKCSPVARGQQRMLSCAAALKYPSCLEFLECVESGMRNSGS